MTQEAHSQHNSQPSMQHTPSAADDFDPHRFDAEPKRKGNRALNTLIMGFVLLMVVVGGAVFLAKQQYAEYMEERTKAKALEDEKKKAENESVRSSKVFGGLVSANAALPAAIATPTPTPSSTPAIDAAPIPVVSNGSPPRSSGNVSSGAAPAPRRVIPMMLDDGKETESSATASQPVVLNTSKGQSGPLGAMGAQVANGAPPVKTIQELRAGSPATTATAQVSAAHLGNRSYLLARGAFIPCVLETQLVSNIAGSTSCVLPQNIYSDDGKVLLLEKGSKIIGEYQSNVKAGDVRLGVLWQRIKTATGVVIDVDSPAADGVGSIGTPGYVDNHWFERIGAAMMVSLLDDAVRIGLESAKPKSSEGNTTLIVPTASVNSTKTLAEKVLDSTINIPPTLYKNRGERLMVYVNRDLWFDSVYKLNQR